VIEVEHAEHFDRLAGVILGTAVGDALGVPREGISRRRAQRLFGRPLCHRFFFGRGMISDDTEHTCMVGQALLDAPEDPDRFVRSLAWSLRLWLLGLPAGIGRATLRSIIKLWLGFSATRSGVWSAGNGPAMRSALLGVCLGQDRERLRTYVQASTRLTHTDPRAERGALLVALAARHGAIQGPEGVSADTFFKIVRDDLNDIDAELSGLLARMEDHLTRKAPAVELADAMGLQRGVTGYIYHSVPLALYCWLRSPGDYRQAVEEVIALGGDTDTTGAIAGAVVGATVGVHGIPDEWIDGILDWPCSVAWMRALAERLARQFPSQGDAVGGQSMRFFWPGLIPRNLLFLAIVLGHVGRRLLPPY
jgi:ADP-ribosylglycohydrolase